MTDNARGELLALADSIVAHGPNTAYPSRVSAQNVRDVVRDLAAALRAAPVPRFDAELVAWRWRYENERSWTYCKSFPSAGNDADVVCDPLYTIPPSRSDAGSAGLRQAVEKELCDIVEAAAALDFPPSEAWREALDRKSAREAAEAIFDYTDNNLSMFEGGSDENPVKARELYDAAKRLRDLFRPDQEKSKKDRLTLHQRQELDLWRRWVVHGTRLDDAPMAIKPLLEIIDLLLEDSK